MTETYSFEWDEKLVYRDIEHGLTMTCERKRGEIEWKAYRRHGRLGRKERAFVMRTSPNFTPESLKISVVGRHFAVEARVWIQGRSWIKGATKCYFGAVNDRKGKVREFVLNEYCPVPFPNISDLLSFLTAINTRPEYLDEFVERCRRINMKIWSVPETVAVKAVKDVADTIGRVVDVERELEKERRKRER